MAYLIQPTDTPIVYVDDGQLAAYLAAGWTQASAAQIAAWHAADPYAGRQTAPPAPTLPKGAPTPATKHVR